MCLWSLNRYLLRFFLNVAFRVKRGDNGVMILRCDCSERNFHTLVVVDLFIDVFFHPYLCWLSYYGHWDDSSSPRKINDLKGNFIIHGRPSFHKVVQNVIEKDCRKDFLFGFEIGKHHIPSRELTCHISFSQSSFEDDFPDRWDMDSFPGGYTAKFSSFQGDYTPQSLFDKVIGSLGSNYSPGN